jgi:fibronectin type 3 domain-containing protein
VTRPPRSLMAKVLSSPISIKLAWTQPTFGQIGAYNIYRGVDSDPGTKPYATVTGTPPDTFYVDTKKVSCGHTYNYFVTAVLQGTSQESVPSNTVTVTKCVGP